MNTVKTLLGAALLSLVTLAAEPAKEAPKEAAKGTEIHPAPYPADYRSWSHVKSMVIFDSKHPLFGPFGGIHHIYANKAAQTSLKAKKDFATGAAFAFDLLEATESGGAYSEGKRKFLAVMYRNEKKFADANGWSWQVYEEGNPLKPSLKSRDAQKACAACHTEVGAKYFVFTEWRD